MARPMPREAPVTSAVLLHILLRLYFNMTVLLPLRITRALRMPLQRAIEHDALELAADYGEALSRQRVIHALHALLDDRAFVEVSRDVMRRCADELHAARVRLVIRLRALEAGQEGMMDVDGAAFEMLAAVRRENLHVARQHQQFRAGLLEDICDPLLLPGLVAIDDGQVVVRHAVPFGEAAQVLVIRDDRDHFDRQRTRAAAVQDAVQAVALLRHCEHRLALAARVEEFPGHPESLAYACRKLAIQIRHRRHTLAVVAEHRAHERSVAVRIVEVLGFGDEPVVGGEEAGDTRHDPRSVRARGGQNEGGLAAGTGGL